MTGNPNVNARDILQYFKSNVKDVLFRVNSQAMVKPFTFVKPTSYLRSANHKAKFVGEPRCML